MIQERGRKTLCVYQPEDKQCYKPLIQKQRFRNWKSWKKYSGSGKSCGFRHASQVLYFEAARLSSFDLGRKSRVLQGLCKANEERKTAIAYAVVDQRQDYIIILRGL